jgi:hypothetical protein
MVVFFSSMNQRSRRLGGLYIITSLATSYIVTELAGGEKVKKGRRFDCTYPFELLVGKADTVLHAHLIANAALLAQDGDALYLDTLLDNAGGVAADGDRSTLHTSPGAYPAAPPDD